VVVISGREDQDIAQRTLLHGASAFIAKSASVPTIIDALQTILRGESGCRPPAVGGRASSVHPDEADAARRVASLTPQQFRVLSMLCSGQSNKRIALQMKVSEATVKAHMTAILEKMGAENRTQAVLIAQRLALHQFAPPAPEDEADSRARRGPRARESARATPPAARLAQAPGIRACRPAAALLRGVGGQQRAARASDRRRVQHQAL
jgi:DNA-binding CsgD family transcriptional regulator